MGFLKGEEKKSVVLIRFPLVDDGSSGNGLESPSSCYERDSETTAATQ